MDERRFRVLLVDDAEKAVLDIVSALSDAELLRTMTTMRPLRDYFDFLPIVVDADPKEGLADRVAGAIEVVGAPDLVMVDLSFDPFNRTGAVDRGRQLALKLRSRIVTPVGVYTKHELKPRYRARIGADSFALTLEEIRKMYEDEDRLTADDWYNVLVAAIRSSHSSASDPTDGLSNTTRPVIKGVAEPPSVPRRASARPPIFVGSSLESLSLARAVQEQLHQEARPMLWNQVDTLPSVDFLTSFLKNVGRFEFGVFVFSPDDLLTIRKEAKRAVRDNVIFELGVFLGRLGRERTFIIAPEGAADVRQLTDLIGMTPTTYKEEDVVAGDDLGSAVGPACTRILNAISKSGPALHNSH
jgi:predicted nucleotide-binding protein